MSRERMAEIEARVILVTGDDSRGLRNAVGHILARRTVTLASVLDVTSGADEIVRRAGEAPVVALRADLDPAPPPDPWVAPKYRATYPTPRRSTWRTRTRRANSHGQRRS